MNLCSYTSIRYLNNTDIDQRFKILFRDVCYLMSNSSSTGVSSINMQSGDIQFQNGTNTIVSSPSAGVFQIDSTVGSNYWTETGNDIVNNNAGTVTINTPFFSVLTPSYQGDGLFFVENTRVLMGDGDASVNGTTLSVDDSSMSIEGNAMNHIFFNSNAGLAQFGDIYNSNNKTNLTIDDANSQTALQGTNIYLGDYGGTGNGTLIEVHDSGFQINIEAFDISIGDNQGQQNGSLFYLNDFSELAGCSVNRFNVGGTSQYVDGLFDINAITGIIGIGDINPDVNHTHIEVNDVARQINMNASVNMIFGDIDQVYSGNTITVSGNNNEIDLDSRDGQILMGDIQGITNGTMIQIIDGSQQVNIGDINNISGATINIKSPLGIVNLGDVDGAWNSNHLSINDITDITFLETSNFQVNALITQVGDGSLFITTPSSTFNVKSHTKGSIPYPVMTTAQMLAIATPALGLMVYVSDISEGLYINKSNGWNFII